MFCKVVSTRWNSTLTMLKSLSVNLADLRALAAELNDKSLQKSLLDVNDDLLEEVIAHLPLNSFVSGVEEDLPPPLPEALEEPQLLNRKSATSPS